MDCLKEFETNLAYHFSEVLEYPFARPYWIYISLTHKCTYNCQMCGVVKILKGYELPKEAVKKALNEIYRWMRDCVIMFTGGEPFLREDLFELIEYSVKRNLKTEVVSNGSLIGEELAYKIISSGLQNIAVSLDGARESTHDFIREKGSFKKAINAIGKLVKAKEKLGKGPQMSIEVDSFRNILPDHRISRLVGRIDLKDLRILELGCLEGAHSFMLQMLGAREIVAIEGRKDNFLKCLILKNAFNLDRCKFLLGDVSETLAVLSGQFDVCLSLGILYHLNNPISLVHRIAQIANNLFVWTHYSTKDYPRGPLVEIKYQDCTYRGKYVVEDTKHYLSGLQMKSFWLFEDDIFKVVKDAGFKNIDLLEKEQHEHGPAMTFLAQKLTNKYDL